MGRKESNQTNKTLHRTLGNIYDKTYPFKFNMKKSKWLTTKSQYAAPRDKQPVSVYQSL